MQVLPDSPEAEAEVLEEYDDQEIQGLVEVATAPPPMSPEELPKLLRGKRPASARACDARRATRDATRGL